jgi:hypothetical protein
MERNSSGALCAPGALTGPPSENPSRRQLAACASDPHVKSSLRLSSCSLHITRVCWLAAVLRPSVLRPSAAAPLTTQPPAAPAPPAPSAAATDALPLFSLSMRVYRSPFCGKPCASARSQRCCGRRPRRRLRRRSVRPSKGPSSAQHRCEAVRASRRACQMWSEQLERVA